MWRSLWPSVLPARRTSFGLPAAKLGPLPPPSPVETWEQTGSNRALNASDSAAGGRDAEQAAGASAQHG